MKTICIVASGPSVNDRQIELIRRWKEADATNWAMAINGRFRQMPWCDLIYARDTGIWEEIHAEAAATGAQLWTASRAAYQRYKGLNWIEHTRTPYLVTSDAISDGNNSGHNAIGLAWWLGFRQMILVGYDLAGDKKDSVFRAWIERMEILAEDLRAEGAQVINCTPGSALACFPTEELEQCLK